MSSGRTPGVFLSQLPPDTQQFALGRHLQRTWGVDVLGIKLIRHADGLVAALVDLEDEEAAIQVLEASEGVGLTIGGVVAQVSRKARVSKLQQRMQLEQQAAVAAAAEAASVQRQAADTAAAASAAAAAQCSILRKASSSRGATLSRHNSSDSNTSSSSAANGSHIHNRRSTVSQTPSLTGPPGSSSAHNASSRPATSTSRLAAVSRSSLTHASLPGSHNSSSSGHDAFRTTQGAVGIAVSASATPTAAAGAGASSGDPWSQSVLVPPYHHQQQQQQYSNDSTTGWQALQGFSAGAAVAAVPAFDASWALETDRQANPFSTLPHQQHDYSHQQHHSQKQQQQADEPWQAPPAHNLWSGTSAATFPLGMLAAEAGLSALLELPVSPRFAAPADQSLSQGASASASAEPSAATVAATAAAHGGQQPVSPFMQRPAARGIMPWYLQPHSAALPPQHQHMPQQQQPQQQQPQQQWQGQVAASSGPPDDSQQQQQVSPASAPFVFSFGAAATAAASPPMHSESELLPASASVSDAMVVHGSSAIAAARADSSSSINHSLSAAAEGGRRRTGHRTALENAASTAEDAASAAQAEAQHQEAAAAATTAQLEELRHWHSTVTNCLVCRATPRSVVLFPCRHLALCDTCLAGPSADDSCGVDNSSSSTWQQWQCCPLCGAAVEDFISGVMLPA